MRRLVVAWVLCTSLAARTALGQTPPADPLAAHAVVPPRLLSDPWVPYPTDSSARGEATVMLVVTVGADGSVRAAEPDRIQEPFSTLAAQAVLGWRYQPATRDGLPIASKILVEVAFKPPAPPPEVPAPDVAAPSTPTPPPPPAHRVDEVVVRGARQEPSRSVSLSRAEVRQIPGTFGDPFRAIEIMPGVTPIVSGLPFFFVRGAPPGNVGYFLDGVRVPLLFHVGAGPSVVHPGLVERVDLYPGGYPARYGRFAGGIVAGETMPPAAAARGEYNVRLFDAGALVEVPFAKGRGTALVGGRYSYTAALLSVFSPNTTLDYWDYQARATYDLTADDRLGVFAFGSYDFLGERTPTETLTLFATEFHRVDLRHDHRLGNGGNLRTALTVGLDRSRLQEGRELRDRLVGTRVELTRWLSPRTLFRAGSDVQVDRYDVVAGEGLAPSQARVAALFPSRSDLTLGMRADIVHTLSRRLEVTPGVRVDFFSSGGATALAADPRLALRTTLTERSRLLTALGVASQPPAFVVPVPGFQPGGLHGGLQRSVQESLGVELDLGAGTTATMTAFHNAFFQMSDPLGATQPDPGCAPGSFPADSLAGDRLQPGGNNTGCGLPRFRPGTLGADRSGGGGQASETRGDQRRANAFEVRTLGSAYGLELFLKRKLTSRLGGFLSYTLSRSTRSYADRDYVATFDRTHVTNAAVAYDLGRSWRAGTRVVFYTGLPKLPHPTDPSTRLEPFFRVDLRLEKRWQLGRRWWISVVAEWLNATLSKEAISTRCTLQGCESQRIGPITIPSLGVEGGF